MLIDSTSGNVYAFVAAHKALTVGTQTCAANTNCVDQFPNSFAAGVSPTHLQPVGTGAANYNLYAGTFDNVFYSSAGGTGALYTVGNTNTLGGGNLYRIPVTAGALGTVATAVTGLNSTEYPWPSPLTEFCANGASACTASAVATTSGNDYVFFSVNRGAASVTIGSAITTGCTNAAAHGCIYSIGVNSETTPTLTANSALDVVTPGTNGCWATGGFIIDNSAIGTTGAAQIYFVGLDGAAAGGPNGNTSTGCTSGAGPTINAVQASQSFP